VTQDARRKTQDVSNVRRPNPQPSRRKPQTPNLKSQTPPTALLERMRHMSGGAWMRVAAIVGIAVLAGMFFYAIRSILASLFLASPYTLRTNGHVGVDLLSHYLPQRHRRRLATIVAIVGMLVCLYLAVLGGELAWESFLRGERSESTWAPRKWPLYLTMPVGLGLTALQYLVELMRSPAPERLAHD